MKNQMIKGLTMLMVVIAVAFATAVVSAKAQSTGRVISNIPFEFVVGNKTLPAGEYQVSSVTAAGEALLIRSTEARDLAVRLSNTIEPQKDTQARLVFHRYGQSYFLVEVWSGGDSTGRQLLESKRERSMRREYAGTAKNGYESVEVVAMVR
jgi:hypothetical protein